MKPYYMKEQSFEVDDYDLDTREWSTYTETLEAGWYFNGEDGASCPHGAYETEQEAEEAQKEYLNNWYKDNV